MKKPTLFAAALAVALAAPPLLAREATATAADLSIAMMDDMMMRKDNKGGMGGMPGGGPMPDANAAGGMQGPTAAPPGMDMMGRMRGGQGMGGMAPASQLPGFPGASHLYHVGATGFFLDHPQHITLTTQQQTSLNRIREKALLERATVDRRIEDAEQELWTLTAADVPDAARIEAQVRMIERLRGDQRLAFIRAVGEAGKVLTTDQQGAVLGTRSPAGSKPPAASKPAPMAPAAPMQHK